MFRTFAYINEIRLTSQRLETQAEADKLLSTLIENHGASGGDVEQYVDGIGWVIADEVETAMIISRRNNSDRD